MLEHFKRTQAVNVSLCVYLIFMANCDVRDIAVTQFLIHEDIFSSFGSIPDVVFWVCY